MSREIPVSGSSRGSFERAPIATFSSIPLRRIRATTVVGSVLRGLVAGIALGVGAHLCQDLFQSQAVKFPFIGSSVDGTLVDDRL